MLEPGGSTIVGDSNDSLLRSGLRGPHDPRVVSSGKYLEGARPMCLDALGTIVYGSSAPTFVEVDRETGEPKVLKSRSYSLLRNAIPSEANGDLLYMFSTPTYLSRFRCDTSEIT